MILWMAELKNLPTLVEEWGDKSSYFPIRALIACKIKLTASRAKVAHSRKFLGFLRLEGREDAFGI